MNNRNIFMKIIPDPETQSYAGTRILSYFKNKLMFTDNKQSTINIINTILSKNSFDTSSLTSTELEYDDSCILSLDNYLNDIPMLEECELSNVDYKTYSIEFDEDEIKPPIPYNEEERLSLINKLPIDSLKNLDELNKICEMINTEMKCVGTMITLVDKDNLYTLAASDPSLMKTVKRKETMCQHMLMDGKPMIVNNPETDIRYYKLNEIIPNKIKFFFGMSIKSHNNLTMGSLCCIDTDVKQVTVSQYSVMNKLANAASRIIEIRGEISEL